MKALLSSLVVCALMSAGVQAEILNNPCIGGSGSQCGGAPSKAFLEIGPNPLVGCQGQTVLACATYANIPGQVIVTTTNSDCSVTAVTNAVNSGITTNWWKVVIGSFSASGQGSCASFIPTSTGTGVVTFYLSYANSAPCSGSGHFTNTVAITVWGNDDSDYDGYTDCQEARDGTDPFNANGVTAMWLAYWSFNNTNWIGESGQVPLSATNLQAMPGRAASAVKVNHATLSRLAYRERETNGWANINCRQGTIRFWFRPDWTSATLGGAGPQSNGRLIELGEEVAGTPTGRWALVLNPAGTQLQLVTATNGSGQTNFTAPISWQSGSWYQLVLAYSPTNSSLYVNGQPVLTNGLGVTHYPGLTVRTNGFRVGSDKNGGGQAKGRFDDLETYNYPQTAQVIAATYARLISLNASNANDCVLRPITVPHSVFATLPTNSSVTVTSWVSSGNFSWVSGDKKNVDPKTLANELTNATGFAYVRSDSVSERVVSIGDWINGDPGLQNAIHIREALDWLITNHVEIILPVWGVHNNEGGSNRRYLVTNYAKVVLTAYTRQGNDSTLTMTYLGSSVCDRRTNAPPRVYAGPDLTVIRPAPAFLNGFVEDDGLINPTPAVTWQRLSGPTGESIANQNTTNATVTFSQPGVYQFRLSAFDGALTGEDIAQVTVLQRPTVTIINPTNNQVLIGPTNILIQATASDDVGVTKVQFFQGTNSLGIDTNAPYSLTWSNVLAGNYALKAIATDTDGLTATSTVVNIVVKQPPVIQILSPTNGAIFAAPAVIRIRTEPFDPDGIVTNVTFFSGSTNLGSVTNYPFYWTLTNYGPGTYTLGATAKDNDGLSTAATPVTITVQLCTNAAVASLTLSTTNIIGGNNLTGTVALTGAAMSGGQTIDLNCTNPAVRVPASIFVPQGSNSASFIIETAPVGVTNNAIIQASYHSNPPATRTLTVVPRPTNGSTNIESAVREGFAANVVVPCGGDGDTCDCCEDGSILFDIGFLITFFSQDYTNVFINMNGTLTFTQPFSIFVPETTIQAIGVPAIAPFWADVDPRGNGSGTMKYGTNTVDGRRAFGVTWDNVGYFGSAGLVALDRSNRFQVVLIERSDLGPGNFDIEFNYDRMQWDTGTASQGNSASIGFGDGEESGFNFEGSGIPGYFMDTNSLGLVHHSLNSPVLGRYLFSVPFPINKQVVFVRDDLSENDYTAFTTTDTLRLSTSLESARFDLRSIDGDVLSAHMERAGELRRNAGTHYDFEWGVGSTISNGLQSFGGLQVSAHLLPIYHPYALTWRLPAALHPDISHGLGGTYQLNLMDRISSLCGNTIELQDLPHANWPVAKNILTFMTDANPQIPQGRCRDIVLSPNQQFASSQTNLPLNGAWDILFNERIIASSGQRNGWSVEEDYTVYGGINIGVPLTAVAASGYQVRLAPASAPKTGFFSVVSSNTLNSAPVLLPLIMSRGVVTGAVPVTVTVALDAPATGNGAFVSLKWEGSSGGTIPPYIVVPPGERTNEFTFQSSAGASNATYVLKASYNGYRKGQLRILTAGGAKPGAPINLTATGELGRIVVQWNTTAGASAYNLKRSTISGGPYSLIFAGLTTNKYVDTQVIPGTNYCYVVSALNDYGESSNSSQACAIPLVPSVVTRPLIIPNGGIFNDSVTVTITNETPGSEIWYTLDGSVPDQGSPATQYSTPFILTSNAIVRARGFRSGATRSTVASAAFVVVGASDLNCGSTNSGSLAASSSFSTNRGAGFFVGRYRFNGVTGRQVTLTLSSTNFDTYLYLVDPANKLVAENDDFNLSNSRIVYTLKTNGTYFVEATSFFPVQMGNYSLSLLCEDSAELGVLYTGVNFPNGGAIDFGVTTVGVNINKLITITNTGSTNLILTNFSIVPSGRFTVSPTGVTPIPPGGSTNLTLTFVASSSGQYNAVFSFRNNDGNNGDGVEDPFIINLSGRANPAGTPPTVTITSPTNNQEFTSPALVGIATIFIQGSSTISNVVFYAKSATDQILIGADNSSPYTVIWNNASGGNYKLQAVITDTGGRVGLSSEIAVFINTPPIAVADTARVPLNSVSNLIQVLPNDSDPDGHTLTNALNSGPSHGSVTRSNTVFFYTPTAGYAGRDSFTYTIGDGHGGIAVGTVSITIPPSIIPPPPVALITAPTNSTRITAISNVIGTASSSYLDLYELQIRPAGDESARWVTFATGTTSVSAGTLGILDPTLMLNGSYDIQLVVTDLVGQEAISDLVTVVITDNMKIGHFSLSFTDLQIPVSGLPITVTRTYDSRNRQMGDFGVGWSLDVSTVRLSKNMVLGENWLGDLSGLSYCIYDAGPHVITITFPDGTVQQFRPVAKLLGAPGPCGTIQGSSVFVVEMDFEPLPGSSGTLFAEVMNDLVIQPVDGPLTINEDSWDSFDSGVLGPVFDATGFVYESRDKRRFEFNAKGVLTRMSDRNNNALTFGPDGIVHSSGKSVKFFRDSRDRITQIYDPNGLNSLSEPSGPAALIYKYDDRFDNLTNVQRLIDKTTTPASYNFTRFSYTNTHFPNYLTGIIDARGVNGTKTYYDDEGRVIAIEDAAGKVTRISHNLNGRVEVMVDRLGNTNSFAYDLRGNLIAQTNPLTVIVLISYNERNLKTAETNAFGTAQETWTLYSYNNEGDPIEVVTSPGRTNSFSHDPTGKPLTQTDPLGNVLSNRYDNAGNLISMVKLDANGNIVQQSSSTYQNGLLVELRNGSNQVAGTFLYDTFGNLTNTTDANSVSRSFGYDANGNQTNTSYTWLGPAGSPVTVTTRTEYNASDLPVRVINTIGNQSTTNLTFYNELGQVTYTVDKFGNTNGSVYDARGIPIETRYPDGSVTRMVYDDEAKPILATDRNGITSTRTEYDGVGRVLRTIRLTNAVVDIVSGSTSRISSPGTPISTNSTEYFPNGLVKSRTTADGRKTTYEYNPDGQPKSVTDSLTNTTFYGYDIAGRQEFIADALNHTNRFVYDAVGQVRKITFHDGTFITNIYNLLRQRVGVIDQGGFITQFGYNVSGQLTNVIKPQVPDPENNNTPTNAIWSYTYDSYGRLTVTTDPKGRNTTNTYDPQGRQLTRRLPGSETETNQYNDIGQLWKKYDFKGQKTEFVYDHFGRTRAKFYFATGGAYPSNAVCYVYNQLGQLSKIIERSGVGVTTNTCDGYVALVGPIGGRPEVSRWNRYAKVAAPYAQWLLALALAAMVLRNTPRPVRAALAAFYLRGGWSLPQVQLKLCQKRVWLPSWWLRAISVVLAILMAILDPAMRLMNAQAATCTIPPNTSTESERITEFKYDLEGRLEQVNSPEGVINYGYDLATGRHSSTCTANSELAYGYDELGRLKTVAVLKRNGVAVANEVTSYTYTKVGSRETVTSPNGVVTTYQYDSLNRLTNLTHRTTNNVLLANYQYQLHPTGRRTNAVEILRQEDANYQTNTLRWAYDAMYRLTNEVSVSTAAGGTYTNTYTYDKVGNRLKKIRQVGSQTETIVYFYNVNDQLLREEMTALNGSLSTNYYGYDANGSLIGKTNTSGTAIYKYNLANKLSGVTAAGVTTSFLYNHDGIRVRSATTTSTNLFLVDANNLTGYAQVLEELNTPGGLPTRSYVIGDDVLAQASSTPSYFLYDGHGSTRQLANTSSSVTSRYNYEAYGSTLDSSSTNADFAATRMLYCGEQYDSTLKMYNLRARFYDPNTGRFNAVDTFGGNSFDPQSLHKYAYAHCDPVNGTDPSGQMTFIGLLAVVAIIGALIGAVATVISTYAYEGRLATFGEIARGAALGALFGVGAFLIPELGVALAAYGIITSGIAAVGLYLDPNVSWDRKLLATGLFIASVWGGTKAVEYTRVTRGYVPKNPEGASLIPESYMNKVAAVDMRTCVNPKSHNEAGFPRDNNWFFRNLLDKHPEYFSADNRAAITGSRPRAPVVDEVWAAHFPEHAAWVNPSRPNILVHHHILQGPVAVPIPRPVHVAWTRTLHPYWRSYPDVITFPTVAGGIAGAEVEDLVPGDFEDDEF